MQRAPGKALANAPGSRNLYRTAAAVVAHLLDPHGTPDPLPRECYGAGDVPVL